MLPRSLMLALTSNAPGEVAGCGPPLDPEYWVRHCEGFQVEADGARLGVVESVGPASPEGLPVVIAVRFRGLRGRTRVMSTGDIVEILPRERRLILGRRPTR